MKEEFRNALVNEAKRRIIEESIPRIKHCLSILSEEEIWWKPNTNSNSTGILILHLCGNVRQWILSGACGLPDNRNRDKEFAPDQTCEKSDLETMLDDLAHDLDMNLDHLVPGTLLTERAVQCYKETPFSMIIHAIEHFSYHTGQIVYYTKYIRNIDTDFYAGHDLTAKG